jgi:hypothetical protein
MTSYELSRSRYLAVPGGSIRPLNGCLCLHTSLTPGMIERYETVGGVKWAVYQACPVHGIRAIEPVLTADLKPVTTLAGKARAVETGA